MPRPLAPPQAKWNWRIILRIAAGATVLAGAAFGAKEVSAFLVSDPRFDLACAVANSAGVPASCTSLEIRGAVYSNRARILSVFSPDFGKSIFNLPLAERRRHLLAVDWVNSAAISRVWPNRMVVTVTERRPVAFAKLPFGTTGRFRMSLVDADGVLLSIPPRVRFRLPVLSGVTEDQTDADRRTRVAAMQHLLEDLGAQAKDVSEINAANTQDLRIIASINQQAVELWIGDQHFRSRYVRFLSFYEEIRKHSGQANVFDLRLDDRILAK